MWENRFLIGRLCLTLILFSVLCIFTCSLKFGDMTREKKLIISLIKHACKVEHNPTISIKLQTNRAILGNATNVLQISVQTKVVDFLPFLYIPYK